MKRTNKLFSSFWVKVAPVFLMLICLGFANANAQNFKPLGEAISAVKAATESLKGVPIGPMLNQNGQSALLVGTTNTSGTSSQVVIFEMLFYARFVELAQENNSVSAAWEAINTQFPPHANQARNTMLTKGKSDLLDLITY